MRELLSNDRFRYRARLIFKYIVLCILLLYALFRFEVMWNVFHKILTVTSPIIIGFVMAFIVNIPMKFIEELLDKSGNKTIKRFKRAIAMLLSYILIFGILIIVGYMVIPQLLEAIVSLQFKIPTFINNLLIELNHFEILQPRLRAIEDWFYQLNWKNFYEYFSNFVKTGGLSTFAQNAYTTITSITTTTINLILSLIFSIYTLYSKDQIERKSKKVVYAFFEEKHADTINHICHIIYKCFYSFIVGRFIDAIIIGILSFILFTIFKIPYRTMISVFVGFTNVIPIVGPFIGGIVGVILIFIIKPGKALVFIVLIVIIQQLDGNIIFPKIAGKSMRLPSTWTLGSVTIGASLLGILGILIFVPLASVIYTLLDEYSERKIQEKQIVIENK